VLRIQWFIWAFLLSVFFIGSLNRNKYFLMDLVVNWSKENIRPLDTVSGGGCHTYRISNVNSQCGLNFNIQNMSNLGGSHQQSRSTAKGRNFIRGDNFQA